MKNKWKIAGITVIMFLFYLFSHELTHGVIAWEYGADNISYGVKSFGFYTSYILNNMTPERMTSLDHAEAMNEITGYTVIPFLMFIMLVLVMMYCEMRGEDDSGSTEGYNGNI